MTETSTELAAAVIDPVECVRYIFGELQLMANAARDAGFDRDRSRRVVDTIGVALFRGAHREALR